MNRWMIVVFLSVLIGSANVAWAAQEPQQSENRTDAAQEQKKTGTESFFGEWEFSRAVAFSMGNAGETLARESLGIPIIFATDRAYIFNKEMRPVYYYRTGNGEDHLIRRYGIDFARLGIQSGDADIVKFGTRPTYSLQDYNRSILIIVNEDTLLTFVEGVWFELKRVK